MITHVTKPENRVFKCFGAHQGMERQGKGVRLYGKQVRDWSSPPPASPGIFYSSYEFPTSENGKRDCTLLLNISLYGIVA